MMQDQSYEIGSYSLPVLHGILPQPYFCHLALLVAGIYIYSSQKMSLEEHKLGEELLLQSSGITMVS